jgi:hypothetical protein
MLSAIVSYSTTETVDSETGELDIKNSEWAQTQLQTVLFVRIE